MSACRVAMWACLMTAPYCIVLMGPDCSSWGVPSRGTTFRNSLNTSGVGHPFVEGGNCMMSRWLV